MCARDYEETLARVRSALAGSRAEVPVAGVTFIAAEAVGETERAIGSLHPAVTLACSRLEPDFVFVDSWEPVAADASEAVARCGTVPFWVVRGPLDASAHEMGWHAALSATLRDPAGLCERFDGAVLEACTSVTRAGECRAGAVVIAEDVAGEAGPLAAPEFIAAEVVPRIGRIARAASDAGLPAIWHSDGDISGFLGPAAAHSITAIHPSTSDGEEAFLRFLANARGLGLTVLGGLPGAVLRAGTAEAMRAARAAAAAAREGGLLICDDGGMSTPEELGALTAALQAARA